MFNLSPNKLNVHNIIKKTSCSTIYPYQKDLTDNRWVVKHLALKDSTELALGMHRISLAFNFESIAILKTQGYCIQQESPSLFNLYIKMPRMKLNLEDFITLCDANNAPVPESQVVKYLYTLLCGLDYLHQKKVAHGNIKGSNILIDNNDQIKLSDVGSLQTLFLNRAMNQIVITDNKPLKDYLYEDDIYRTGLMILGLCSLNLQILANDFSVPENQHILDDAIEQMKMNYSKDITEFLVNMICKDSQTGKTAQAFKLSMENIFKDIIENVKLEQNIKATSIDKEKLQTDPSILENSDSRLTGKLQQVIETLKMNWKECFDFESDTSLVIKAKDKNKITDKVLQNLMSDIVHQITSDQIPDISHFELDLSNCSMITDEGVSSIAISLGSNFNKLKLLKLYFPWCVNITDEGVIQLSAHISQNLKHIKTLTLYFSKCTQISNKALEMLGRDLGEHHKDLQHLDLFFSWCQNITDEGVRLLSSHVGDNLKNLKDLALYFSCCSMITDEGARHLASNISQLKGLHSLAFKMNGCSKLTDQGVKSIVSCLDTTADTLKSLVLDFYGCYSITDEGIKYLSTKLGYGFLKLQHLTLILSNCSKVTDEGIKHICSNLLKGLTSITEINFNFYGCKITDEGIQRLALSLGQNLNVLQKLILSFAGCTKVTDASVKEMANSIITNLKGLYKLSLDFSGCTKISDDSVKFLAINAGRELKTLQELSLYVSKCHKVSIALDDQFIASLAKIKKLKIC